MACTASRDPPGAGLGRFRPTRLLARGDVVQQAYAHNRQRFLAEQGHRYTVMTPAELTFQPERRAA